MAAAVDPTSATPFSLPGPLLRAIFKYNFPVNTLMAVATCKHLHATLAEQLKAAVRFRKTEWVILGELQTANLNNRAGQIVGVKPEDSSRCAVQVDGLSCKSQNQMKLSQQQRAGFLHTMGHAMEVPTREVGSRMVGVSRFKLYAFHSSNRGMLAAVRLPAHGEIVTGSLEGKYEEVTDDARTLPIFASETKIPRELAMFAEKQGQSPLMADLGRPILLRQVVPLSKFRDPGDGECLGSTRLRLHDRYGVMRHKEWFTDAGPTVVAWLDQADFTLADMRQVWRFCVKALKAMTFRRHAQTLNAFGSFDPRRKLSDQDLQNMWQESAMMEPVTETVFHDESPARIEPDEARTVVEVQQESTISHDRIPSSVAELACVVTFHRTPEALDRALGQSDLGRRLREMGQTLKPAWAHGAKILVEGLTEETWTRACQDAGLTLNLRPGDVVLPTNALTNILGEIQKIPHSSRPRLKAGKEVISIPDLSHFADLSDRPGPSSSVSFSQDSSLSSDASETGWLAFIDGLRDKILHVPIPSGYTSLTFVHQPEEAPVTPRSMVTESDSANAGVNLVNPRVYQ